MNTADSDSLFEPLHRLITRLLHNGQFGVEPGAAQIRETHLSLIVLAGEYVYKFKKAVDFGFADFSTALKRRRACEAELRLNSQLAADYYLAVLGVIGPEINPKLSAVDIDHAIDYCVKMRRFADNAEFDKRLQRDTLDPAHVLKLAELVAGFHTRSIPAPEAFGTAAAVTLPALENSRVLAARVGSHPAVAAHLECSSKWIARAATALAETFAQRHADGRIRACHGDLHLGNIALDRGSVVVFDCIEFNDTLRFIDVASDVAFVVMDLAAHGRADLGNRFLNAYLDVTGDYDGVAVLRYYSIYRAMVRAKVAALSQQGDDELNGQRCGCKAYLRLACALTTPRPQLVITHGLSGSGKSVLSNGLAQRLDAIRIRSDVERKRLHGMPSTDRPSAHLKATLYGQHVSNLTYERLCSIARTALKAGYSVVVDGAFLLASQRRPFRHLADELAVPFTIVELDVPVATLRERVTARLQRGDDPSDADNHVLDRQLRTREGLTAVEQPFSIRMGHEQSGAAGTIDEVAERLVYKRPLGCG